MTRTSDRRSVPRAETASLRLAAAAALAVASACAAPILATGLQGDAGRGEATTAAPASCGVAIETLGEMTTFRPWVELDRPRAGSYRFALSGGGTALDQGGSIEPDAAGRSLLGEATVTGRATDYDVEMSIEVEGRHYRCNVHPGEV